jgi:hypothetical protein
MSLLHGTLQGIDSKPADILGNVALIELIFSIFTFLLMFITINLMNCPPDTKLAVYVIGIAVLLDGTFTMLFKSIYRAFEKMEYEAIGDNFRKIYLCMFGFFNLVLWSRLDWTGFYLYLSANLIISVCFFYYNKKIYDTKIQIEWTSLEVSHFNCNPVRIGRGFKLDLC